MNKIAVPSLENVVRSETYSNNSMKLCYLGSETKIQTEYGELIPKFTSYEDGDRQKKDRPSITFFKNGEIKSIALERQLPIQTPLGEFPAELVTFYKDGSLKRIFPSNAKVDGFWSEQQEGEVCETFSFDLPNVSFTAKIISICFYESGALKSIALWPGEIIEVTMNEKLYKVRNGIAFYEDGKIKSIEPSTMTVVTTPIGKFLAFDKDAIGVHGDTNSLEFSPQGEVIALITTHSGVKVELKDQKDPIVLEPLAVDSIIEFGEKTILPLSIKFEGDHITFTDLAVRKFPMKDATFTPFIPNIPADLTCTDCATCKACKGIK